PRHRRPGGAPAARGAAAASRRHAAGAARSAAPVRGRARQPGRVRAQPARGHAARRARRGRRVSAGCPSDETVARFAEGVLSDAGLAAVESHLVDCAECRGVVAAVTGEGPAAGARIGRYRLLEPIGAGGMGVVYAALDTRLGRKVALQLLRGGADHRPELATRLVREAHAMARIAHPNVITVHDVGQFGDQVYLAMELVDGPTLRTWLETPRPWREVLAVALQAAAGLVAAHDQGLVHRDVQPDNILVAGDGRVRVTDFGLVALGAEADVGGAGDSPLGGVVTADGAVAGSPAYMAPEQLDGEAATARSDVFSFCVTLHEALFGERPFAGRSVAELRA